MVKQETPDLFKKGFIMFDPLPAWHDDEKQEPLQTAPALDAIEEAPALELAQPLLPEAFEHWPLSQRVQVWREQRRWSPAQLATRCDIPLPVLETIEAGVERVLSTTLRKRLAKGLQVPSSWLLVGLTLTNLVGTSRQDAKKQLPSKRLTLPSATHSSAIPMANETPLEPLTLEQVFAIYNQRLPFDAMLANPSGHWPCPQCGALLQVKTFPRETAEGDPLCCIRLHCTSCLFRLEEERPALQPDW